MRVDGRGIVLYSMEYVSSRHLLLLHLSELTLILEKGRSDEF